MKRLTATTTHGLRRVVDEDHRAVGRGARARRLHDVRRRRGDERGAATATGSAGGELALALSTATTTADAAAAATTTGATVTGVVGARAALARAAVAAGR